jgi:hypothetical protein
LSLTFSGLKSLRTLRWLNRSALTTLKRARRCVRSLKKNVWRSRVLSSAS